MTDTFQGCIWIADLFDEDMFCYYSDLSSNRFLLSFCLKTCNPFQYKKGFSKVNSLFCTVKAIYDRVIFHIWPYLASKQGKIPMFKIDRMYIFQGKSSKERKVPMFNLCKTKEFQHRYLNTNIISLYPISPFFKHGKIPIFRCHGCKF